MIASIAEQKGKDTSKSRGSERGINDENCYSSIWIL